MVNPTESVALKHAAAQRPRTQKFAETMADATAASVTVVRQSHVQNGVGLLLPTISAGRVIVGINITYSTMNIAGKTRQRRIVELTGCAVSTGLISSAVGDW